MSRKSRLISRNFFRDPEDIAYMDNDTIDDKEQDYIVKNAQTLDTGNYWGPVDNSIDRS